MPPKFKVTRNKRPVYRAEYKAKFGPKKNYNALQALSMRYKRSQEDCSKKQDALRELYELLKKKGKAKTAVKIQNTITQYKHGYSTNNDRKIIYEHKPMVFKHPFNMIVAGPSQCGKTTFVQKLLENREAMIDPNVSEILWFYGSEGAIREVQEKIPEIKFFPGQPDLKQVENFDPSVNRLLVVDDLMLENNIVKTLSTLFTRTSHHCNMSVVFLIQNLYEKIFRTITTNAKYIIMFSHPRDVTQVRTLNSQVAGLGSRIVTNAARDIASKARGYGYLMCDFSQNVDPCKRFRADIFPDDKENTFYVKAGDVCSENELKDAIAVTDLASK